MPRAPPHPGIISRGPEDRNTPGGAARQFAAVLTVPPRPSFLFSCAVVYLVFAGLGVRLSVPVLAVFICLFWLSGVVVITPGNLGLRELAYSYLAGAVGVDMSLGLAAAAVIRLVHYGALALMNLLMVLVRQDLGRSRPGRPPQEEDAAGAEDEP